MENGRVAVIDMDSILFAAAWGKKIIIGEDELGQPIYKREGNRLVYENKSEDEIKQSLDDIMNDILYYTGATAYIAFVKGKNTAAHRYQAKSDYKSNRPKESPHWWEFTKKYAIEKWNSIEVNNIETDDAVNITRLNIPNSFIVAIDKDLLNLEGRHYNWKTREWITINSEEAEIAFWKDMVVGQPGDGIKGLPKKGNVYFKQILENVFSYELYTSVLAEYVHSFGEKLGIEEYYKNYTCLKILEEYEGFVIPEPTEYKIEFTDSGGEFDELFKGI